MYKFIKIIKKIKIKNMLILILLLIFNTYAWFIYATRVNTEITAHVSSWNVEFIGAEGEIITNLSIEIGRIFPGMEGDKKFEKIVEVRNNGETKAQLGFEIEILSIMGETFTVNETDGPTTQDIIDKINTEYPFKIKIEVDDAELQDGTGYGKFIIGLEWPFESGDDEADTYWGNKAYEYFSTHPEENSIKIDMILKAIQKAE